MLLGGRSHLTESSGDQSSVFWHSRLEGISNTKSTANDNSPFRPITSNDLACSLSKCDRSFQIESSSMKTASESQVERSRLATIIKERFENSQKQLLVNEDNKSYIERIKNVLNTKQCGYQSRSYSPKQSPKSTQKSSLFEHSQKLCTENQKKIRPSTRHQSFRNPCFIQTNPIIFEIPTRRTPTTPNVKSIPKSPDRQPTTLASRHIPHESNKVSLKGRSKISMLIDSLLNKENYLPSRPGSPVAKKNIRQTPNSRHTPTQKRISTVKVDPKSPHQECIVVDMYGCQLRPTADESVLYYVVEDIYDSIYIDDFSEIARLIAFLETNFSKMSSADLQLAIRRYVQLSQKPTISDFEVFLY